MNKAELLEDLAAKVIRVISVAKSADATKESTGVHTYVANVLEGVDNRAQGRNIGFYVVDEGEPTESAHYKDAVATPKTMYEEALAYLASLGYVRTSVTERHPDLGFAIARAWADNGDGTVSEKQVMIYYDQDGKPAHKEIA